MNERGRYNAIMIEITYGALLSCRSTALSPNLLSRGLQLGTCQLECLARSSGICGHLHKHTCIAHPVSKNKMCTRYKHSLEVVRK